LNCEFSSDIKNDLCGADNGIQEISVVLDASVLLDAHSL